MENQAVRCQALIAAIVQQAVADIRDKSTKPTATRNRRQAITWLRAQEQGRQSFIWCCATLGLDPERIRTKVLSEAGLA